MRIGIDVYAVQSLSRERGIGRYGRELIRALLAADHGHELVLYVHPGLPDELVPEAPEGVIRRLAGHPAAGGRWGFDALNEIVRRNPDDLDVMLLTDMLNPYEPYPDSGPPAMPLGGRPLMASVVYDLIPFLFQEKYLRETRYAASFYRRLERVQRYDILLAISEATRQDALSTLGLPDDRVVSIGTGGNGRFFVPDRTTPPPRETLQALASLGIDRPFVLNLGGMDDRKNLHGLVDAFGLLPEPVRRPYQLVIACHMNEHYAAELQKRADRHGVAEQLVVTGSISDEVLRILYQRCAAFVFPSHFEGFGLPILEAMHCGAAVVAGNNSSQIEVVGDAGLLANTRDPSDIASKLGRILAEPDLATELSRKALTQSERFSWEITATKAVAALEQAVARKRRGETRRWRRDAGHRETVAVFTPLHPRTSTYGDDSARLIAGLQERCSVHVFHAPGYVPHLGMADPRLACFDHHMFRRMSRVVEYRALFYQAGPLDHFSAFVSTTMHTHPGVVTLHAVGESADHMHPDTKRVIVTSESDRETLCRRRPEMAGRTVVVPRPADGDDEGWQSVVRRYVELMDQDSSMGARGRGAIPRPENSAREGRWS